MAFLRMLAICLHIPQIIETIDTARNKTERGKHHKRRPEEFRLQQIVAEEDRRKDKKVLQPLQRTEQSDVFYHRCKDTNKREQYKIKAIIFLMSNESILERSSKIVQIERKTK